MSGMPRRPPRPRAGSEGPVRRDTATQNDRPGAGRPRRPDRLRDQDIDHCVLETPGQLGDDWLGQWLVGHVPKTRVRARLGDDPSGGRLETREAEVERVAHPGSREHPVVRRRRLGRTADRGTARIAEAEQPADLVECLARGVVDGRAKQSIGQVVAHLGEERVTARDDDRNERKHRLGRLRTVGVAKPRRVDVALEMVDPDQRPVVDPRKRLREVDPDEKRAGEPGSVRDGDRPDVVPRHARVGPRFVEHGHDPANVRSRGDLRDDPARWRVQRDLRRDDVGQDARLAVDDGDAGLVARRFDREDERPAHQAPVTWRARRGAARGRCCIDLGAESWPAARASPGRASGSVVMIRASSPLSL